MKAKAKTKKCIPKFGNSRVKLESRSEYFSQYVFLLFFECLEIVAIVLLSSIFLDAKMEKLRYDVSQHGGPTICPRNCDISAV